MQGDTFATLYESALTILAAAKRGADVVDEAETLCDRLRERLDAYEAVAKDAGFATPHVRNAALVAVHRWPPVDE